MTDTRHHIADVLFTAAILGVGLTMSNKVIADVIGGIGVNLASGLTRSGWQAARQRLLRPSGLLDNDLQQVLARAFHQALEIATQIGEWRVEESALNGLGQACEQRGDTEKARQYYRQAQTIHQRARSAEMLTTSDFRGLLPMRERGLAYD